MALTATALFLRQRHRRTAYKRAGLDLLDQLQSCEDQLLPSETNRLLKRVALMAFPGERIVINQLFGDAWVAWLNDHCTNAVFTGAPADALAHGGYRSDLPCDRQELLRCTRDWLRHHKHRSPATREPRRV